MEKNWTKETDSYGEHWCDESGRLVKAHYFVANFTSYYDEDGDYHRLDGPAHIRSDGKNFWFYHGREIPCQSQQEFERFLRLKAFW